MGGGVGVSIHGSHRIVSEKLMFAMPETGIGLFPDVGGTYFLPRCPGLTGIYLGLTGARLKAADALYTGIATHHVKSSDLAALFEALCKTDDIDSCIAGFAADAGPAGLKEHEAVICDLFGSGDIQTIVERCETSKDDWVLGVAKTLRQKSPTSLAITLRQLRAGADLSFEECMKLEFRIVSRIAEARDFFEGTRAVVIDKDMQPKWQPARLEDVSVEMVDSYFAPLEDELEV